MPSHVMVVISVSATRLLFQWDISEQQLAPHTDDQHRRENDNNIEKNNLMDDFDYNSYFQSTHQHQSQQQVQQQFCRSSSVTTVSGSAPTAELIGDIDLKLNKTILLLHWHLTTSCFELRGRNIRDGRLQVATT